MNGRFSEPGDPWQAEHITCVVSELLPIFSQPELVAIVFDCWRGLREQQGMRLHAYVIMEEHLHFLVRGERLDACLVRFMDESARRMVALLKQRGLERFLKRLPPDPVDGLPLLWQEPPEVEALGEGEVGKTLEYIHINPVKRGYVERAEQWRYSSAREYAGERGLVEIDLWVAG